MPGDRGLVGVGEGAFDMVQPSATQSTDGGSVDSVSAMSWTTGLNSGNIQDSYALVLLPPASIQTAQSNSPVKSQRLQDLDARYYHIAVIIVYRIT